MSMDVVSWTQDNQTLDNLTSFNESIFYGTTNNQSTRFQVTIGQFPNTTINTFAGEDMQMASNSLKYTIKIIDWVWSSPFSTLQVIFHSRSDSVEYDECGVVSVALFTIIVIAVIIFLKRLPSNRPPNNEPPIEMDVLANPQQQQNNNNNDNNNNE
ncbi:hypothetical protein DFA_07899 [Cavenderia fasciculata]|uniref:Transmembrane protein n=1 Tax=Cavenderia fasciculata TaxID=261658 RepID=F4Q404_CACFS|nr:uncharacterized protein DFA_07899 [Cavenderia fasciculata]EGG16918.1 hypothetical protein DFA_07899 [Cavenderia fasciculata]|eukprot:XP_004355392.1 hypothetical protein DFA_07899 [Cavenderia fasciculata]